jgi:hypothetical protein
MLIQAAGAMHCAMEWVWGEFNHLLKLSAHIFKPNQAIAIKTLIHEFLNFGCNDWSFGSC